MFPVEPSGQERHQAAVSPALLIGVCGGSGSGKTTLANRLVETLGADAAIGLSFDSYYRDLADVSPEERAKVNFDHPDSLDVDMLIGHLRQLRDGNEVAVPSYDFANNTRSGHIDLVQPRRFIVVEGILLFAFTQIRDELDVLIFRHCDEATRASRRLHRDVAERGRSPESVVAQWTTTVQPMHELHVEPYARHADVVTTQNQPLDEAVATITARLRAAVPEATAVAEAPPSCR